MQMSKSKVGYNPVHALIKSMTKQEKIYFRCFATLSGKGDLSYLKLFDTLDSMAAYDDAKLRRKLKAEAFFKRLAYIKNYLKNTGNTWRMKSFKEWK